MHQILCKSDLKRNTKLSKVTPDFPSKLGDWVNNLQFDEA